ncbi:hypothetical protein FIBSPDRAFT_866704 [Athelia psychrophila]|uniref:Uncharacterized protein n=1 Tax=Athelia psychrophila TaxID=1759441 RepID=A0A166EI19_9AGAM|nr:hypothetical protein FIBSPDRAFT_866704 [Fibularhizoctonia sp. CBS 109695]
MGLGGESSCSGSARLSAASAGTMSNQRSSGRGSRTRGVVGRQSHGRRMKLQKEREWGGGKTVGGSEEVRVRSRAVGEEELAHVPRRWGGWVRESTRSRQGPVRAPARVWERHRVVVRGSKCTPFRIRAAAVTGIRAQGEGIESA